MPRAISQSACRARQEGIMNAALTPECHFDIDGEDNEGPSICEFCGDWTPCECDIQIMQELDDDYEGEAL
jgi:hypothetical protein